jgi:chromosome segregation protein
MVSQGRVGTIVNARPDERRSLLEEAAGITGLHARRHEAELKLRAAEANVERAEDLRGQLEQQLAGLQLQARQAARYRLLSTTVKTSEAELLSIQRARAVAAREAAHAALAAARAAVGACADEAKASQARAEAANTALPALRAVEADARTALERHKLAREQVAAEAARARDALAAAAQRRAQIARDLAHAEQAQTDSASATARLAAEAQSLQDAEADAPARLAAAQSQAETASEAVRAAEREANLATEQAAELSATSQALGQALAAAESRARRLGLQLSQLRDERERAARNAVAPEALKAADDASAAAGQRAIAARGTWTPDVAPSAPSWLPRPTPWAKCSR